MSKDRKCKVGVFTLYHDNTNYGATLQAYALQQKIIECDKYDACVVDFYVSKRTFVIRLAHLLTHPKRIPQAIRNRMGKYKRRSAYGETVTNEWFRLRERKIAAWKNFCKRHINVTEPVPSSKLQHFVKQFDILISGSDQVWNPSLSTPYHFLPFRKEGFRKLAYAASISRPMLTEKEKEWFRKWIPDYDCITVRENEGKQLLESFLDITVDVVLDPVLLLRAEDWMEIAEPIDIGNQVSYRKADGERPRETGYLLFIALGDDPSHREFAQAMAERIGLRIVILSTTLSEMAANKSLPGEELVDLSPGQYLTLVHDASCVITDSFHCMAFSILFGKRFYVLKRDPDSRNTNMNSRLYTLLEALGLEDRLVEANEADTVSLNDYDYALVSNQLNELRNGSERKLREMLMKSNG